MRVLEFWKTHSFKIILFLFVVAAFFVLSYRNELHDKSIRHTQAEIQQNQIRAVKNFNILAHGLLVNCESRRRGAINFNNALTAVVLADPNVAKDPTRRANALRQVKPFQLTLDDCSKYPAPQPSP